MSRPRYQRYQVDNYERNGMNDGWMRPPGAAPQAYVGGKVAVRGPAAAHCRYWVTWIVRDGLNKHPELRCSFDEVRAALLHVADHPETMSGGIYDRKKKRWVL